MPAGFYRFMRVIMLRWCLGVFAITGLTACGGELPTPTLDYSPCMPEVRDGSPNIYEFGMLDVIKNLVQQTSPINLPTLMPNGAQPGSSIAPINSMGELANTVVGTQYTVSQYLMGETIRATDVISIKANNMNEVHIVITFLSPLLIQAAYLNDYILQSQPLENFEARLLTSIAKTGERGELLFLVSIITNNPDATLTLSSVLDIPIDKMMLVNADGLQVKPEHYDRNLDQPFESSRNFESGILGYPIGVQRNGLCQWVLDPKYNRNIVIVGTSITTGQDINATHTWTIPYEALVDPAAPAPPVDPFSSFDPAKINIVSAVTTPPIPSDTSIQSTFWQDYSQFVRAQIMQGK